uniref:Autophagy-related protein 9 n=1 Tax=Globodera rostochiensis TaxID=31243 RepID=A0A914HKF9_GLORO
MFPFNKKSSYCPIEEEAEEEEGPQSLNGGAPEQNGRSMLGTGLCQNVSKGQKRDRDGNMCESAFPQVPKELGVSFKCEKDAEMSSTREGLARWDHVGDVDQFFSYIYEYYQQKGIRCIAFRYVFSLFRFAFVVFFSTFLLQCVDYGVIFNTRNTTLNGTPLPEKKGIQDVFIPQCHRHLNFLVKIALVLAFMFWVGHFMRIGCRLIQFCEIKRFFATQLQIYDNDLQNLSWNDVVHSLCQAQERIHLIVSRDSINSLDIYQRILRHRNYFVALVYKSILPPQIGLPLVGNVHYLSSGLRFNLEWLLFWGPWSPWKSSYALKDEFKERDNLERIAQHMRMTIVVMSVVNLVFMPFVAVYQVLSSFFSYSEHFQRDPHILGMRKYSNYGREKLRHFNEMDSELDARLNRSYEFAVRYTDQFVSPLAKIIAKNVAFVAAAFFVVLCALTAYDEDTLKIEHITTLITVTGAIVLACRVFIPNEHLVFCQQLLMRQIVANIHYAPKSWLNKAHSTDICTEFTQIFRLKAELLVEELLSPLLTPFLLYFRIRPRVMEIIEFFHKYTVHVDGLGDVCALAQMDICRDGDARLASINCSVIVGDCSNSLKHRQKNSSGKVELSLLNFAAQHPDWKPSKECSEFIGNVKALVAQEISVGAHEIGGDANGAETSLLDAQTLALLQASAYASLHQMEKSQQIASAIMPSSALIRSSLPSQYMEASSATLDEEEERGGTASSPPPPPLAASIRPPMGTDTSHIDRSQSREQQHLGFQHPSTFPSQLTASTFVQPLSLAAIVQPRNIQESNFRALEMSMQALAINHRLFNNSPPAPLHASRHRLRGGYGSMLLGSVTRRGPDLATDSMADSNIFGVPAGASQIQLSDETDNTITQQLRTA